MLPETILWSGGSPGHARLLEQTLLPERELVLEVHSVEEMSAAIRRLAVRGAPAIGVAAAFGVLLGIQHLAGRSASDVVGTTRQVASRLASARPTAINLGWALERMIARAEGEERLGRSGDAVVAALFLEARAIFEHDRLVCERLGEQGAELIRDGSTVLTHCNAGSLATAGIGTALAPIYRAHSQGKRVAVFVGETRPLLQGARLTAWELSRAGIDVTLMTDSMAAHVMFQGRVDTVFVGADRVARNGDVANKIGTYGLAVLAREHGIPFYVVAPLSTFDPKIRDGSQIPIEERDPEEVTCGFGRRTAPEGVRVYNPAFDVTPARFVTAIVTEVGTIEAPDLERVEAALRLGGVAAPALRAAD